MFVAHERSEMIFEGEVLRNGFEGGVVKENGIGEFGFEEVGVREEPDVRFLWEKVFHGGTEGKHPEERCEFVGNGECGERDVRFFEVRKIHECVVSSSGEEDELVMW